MPLVSLQKVLSEAVTRKYAVGSFNATHHLLVEGILAAAEKLGVPVIVSIADVHFRYLDAECFFPYLRQRIAQSSVPVALHLDHGMSFGRVMEAIHYGFSSVMIDASREDFAGNVRLTKQVVEAAHAAGVSVEAELGHVAGGEGNLSDGSEADAATFTDPEQAGEFVERTGVDALAIAVGTVHGPYKGEPKLDFDRVAEIRKKVNIPLVLHGGSGLSDQDFRRMISLGINKINFFTGISLSTVEAVSALCDNRRGRLTLPDLLEEAQNAVADRVETQIKVFGTQPLRSEV